MAVYNIDGAVISASTSDSVSLVLIHDIKAKYPSYTDDQLLDEAIIRAKELGGNAKIFWDGSDIHFDGATTHICKGFGGIDFNGSKIYMPNYDRGIILKIEPDSTLDLTVSADVILKDRTTDQRLKNKIFTMNDGGKTAGNQDMCLGVRTRTPLDPNDIVYWSPTIITDLDGKFKTGELFLTPTSGEVTCYNVHDFSPVTFEVCNGTIVSYSSTSMSNFLLCTRSNTCIHGFVLEGKSNITSYRDGIFYCNRCSNIEVYDIYGLNPVQKDLASGYALYFRSITSLHVHDIFCGDSTRWGIVGSHFLHDSVFERCNMNRWDCHFAQTGFNVIRECVLGNLRYGVGRGNITVENCIIKNDSENNSGRVELRSDCVGVFNGDIVIRNCIFCTGDYALSDVKIWDDRCWREKPNNSVLVDAPLARRVMENCTVIGAYDTLFSTGTSYENDKSLFKDLVVEINGMSVNAKTAVVYSPSSIVIDKVLIDKCSLLGTTLNNLSCDLVVTDSDVDTISSSVTIPTLIAVGNNFTGTQTLGKFTKYSMYGNVASDMASVNKHS